MPGFHPDRWQGMFKIPIQEFDDNRILADFYDGRRRDWMFSVTLGLRMMFD
jgi:hypothetical protein